MNLYKVTVVRPQRRHSRSHDVSLYRVVAPSEETIKEDMRSRGFITDKDIVDIKCLEVLNPLLPTVVGTSITSIRPAEVAKLCGFERMPAKPVVPLKRANSPLGVRQIAVLNGLVEHDGWPGKPGDAWNHTSESKTLQMCNELRARSLVDLKDGRYYINDPGRQKLKGVA